MRNKISKIRKRDGKIVDFEQNKITKAIFSAMSATEEGSEGDARNASDKVVEILNKRFNESDIPNVEQIQDIVEEVLSVLSFYKSAKAYIIYRDQHSKIREINNKMQVDLVDQYLTEADWQVKENSNMSYSLQGLNNYISSEVSKTYWLNKIYPPEIKNAYLNGDFHIHDLGLLSVYCVGWDLQDLLTVGFGGVSGKTESRPAKHFRAALGQVVNFLYTLQGEAAGAQAFSFDGQTPITIRRNGEMESITLEMLFDDYKHQAGELNGSEVILTKNIYRRFLLNDANKRKYIDSKMSGEAILFQYDQIEVLTEKGFIPLKVISRHKIKGKNDELLIVETEDGNVLRVSRSHPIILADGSIKRADKLTTGDKILSSSLKIELSEKIRLESDFAYLIGFMIAKGCWGYQTKECLIVSQKKNAEERRKIESVLNKLKIPHFENGKFDIVFGTTSIERFISNHLKLQEGSQRKNLPQFIFNLKKENIGDLISGLIDGDGDVDKNKIIRIRSESYTLLMQLKQLLGILGINSTIRFAFYKNTKENYKDAYVIRFRIEADKFSFFKQSVKLQGLRPETKESSKFSAKVVKVVKAKYSGEFVYDITTENEHFLINNIVVHNSNFDTLMAPFIRYDKLSYPEVRQAMQEFIFNMNVPTRVGFQTPYTNLTFDLTVPEIYAKQPVVIGGKLLNVTYSDFQKEMNMVNKAFLEIMTEGDAKGRVFTFPIPTYNITKDFDWNNPIVDLLDEVTAKYGLPYFSNFISSDMEPSDVRSMCCRLRLDLTELKKRGGGYFGANPLTGCYDEKTEILTTNGWKYFRNLTLDDEVFTLSKDNKIEVHKPVRLFTYNWNGDLYRFKAKSLDLLVTPNHKMVVDDARTGKRKLVKAEDFDINNYRIPKQGKWDGKETKYFILPEIENERTAGNHQDRLSHRKRKVRIPMDDWLKFFGFWLAEGNLDNDTIAAGHGYRVFIPQPKKGIKEEIRNVLEKLPFHFRETDGGLEVADKQLWAYLKQFGHCYDRFIPKEVKRLSARQLEILFDWMVKGNGYFRSLKEAITKQHITYYTASKRLAGDIQEVAMKIGWLGTITKRKVGESLIKEKNLKSSSQYVMELRQSTHCRLRQENIKLKYYQGKVYSCEVNNHTLFVRRNGKSCWSGNSIGVVTINMPRLGYLSKSENEFFERLEKLMILAKNSLEIKRKTLERLTDVGLYPYTKFYLRAIKQRFNEYWKNHFSTIGLVGMNEACLNLVGKNIGTPGGQEFGIKTLNFMRDKMLEFQKETGNIYNLEATPAEGSLDPSEKVLISQSDPKMVEIGSLIDGYLDKNKEKIVRLGQTEILKMPEGKMFTYGFSRDKQKMKKYPVTALVRHKGKSMYEITTLSGRKVKVTGQHSVFTLNFKGEPEEILVRNLGENSFVAIPKKIEMEETHKEINLVDVFKDADFKNYLYLLAPSGFVEEIINRQEAIRWSEENYETKWKDVKFYWNKNKIIPLKLIYDLEIEISRDILKASKIFYRLSGNIKPINALIPIDKNFGFVLGSLLTEGWLLEGGEFTNTDKSFVDKFVLSLEKVFGKNVFNLSIRDRSNENTRIRYAVELSKIISLFLGKIGISGKSGQKKVPGFIFFSSLEAIKGLLAGYYFGDGYFYQNKENNDYSLCLYANSEKLAEGLNLCLLRLGILAKIRKDEKSKHNPLWKGNYVLLIAGADNLNKYFDSVLEKKLNLANLYSSQEVLPRISSIIKRIAQKHRIKLSETGIQKDSFNRDLREGKIGLQYLKTIIGKLSNIRDEGIEKIKTLLNSDLYWDKIKEIKQIIAPEYVYDLEVDVRGEKVNNFLGGQGLVCLHNTSYRLALKDKERYPDIICANEEEYKNGAEPFYTNSSQLPVDFTDDIFEALDLQDELQTKYTGGTTVHLFLGEKIDDPTVVKHLVKRICEKYRLPYFTITPTFSICPVHGYIAGEHYTCPKCGAECEVYSRSVGYLRPVKQWNKGKAEEFKERKTFKVKNE